MSDKPDDVNVADRLKRAKDAKARREKTERRRKKANGPTASDARDDDATIQRLAAMRALDYERVRDAAAAQLGCRVSMLDRSVAAARGDGAGGDKGQGTPLHLPLPEPWPQPVDGVALIAELTQYFATHAVLPEHGALLAALWSIHTHCYPIWRYTPRLHITAATKRAGKTRVLRLLKLIACKALSAENVTPAAVFRSVAAVHPTLLIDEADVSLRDNPELVSILNGGHEQGGAAVRTVGEDHEPRQFDTFAPVAVAGIGRLPGTLEDRAVKLSMRRALRSEQPAKITSTTEETAGRLQMSDAKPDMGDLINRIEDNWTPLYAIAMVTGGPDLLAEVKAAMAALTPDDDDADSLGERLIHDIREVFNTWIAENPHATDHEMTSAEIVKRLHSMEERSWTEMSGRNPRPLTTNLLARLLRPFKVYPGKVGPKTHRVNGYRLLAFTDAFARHPAPSKPVEG